jgi:hypothetical protein
MVSGDVASPLLTSKVDGDELHASAALPRGNNLWQPMDRRFGGPQNWSERCRVEKNLMLLL